VYYVLTVDHEPQDVRVFVSQVISLHANTGSDVG
jgi:hypothetical protein